LSASGSTSSSASSLEGGLPIPRRYWAAGTVLIGISLSVLDTTIANVALPTIAQDLHIDPADAVWIINAYTLAVVMMLLPLASLAEKFGFRRMYTIGLALFTLASLACAMSDSLFTLTAARAFQGVGAATLMCLFAGLVRHIYPISKLGRGLSLNSTMVALMSVLGPTVGSAILSVASWPWIFAVNLPICALALYWVRYLPDVPRSTEKYDIVSALLSMITLGVFITGVDHLIAEPVRGVAQIAVSAVAGWLLVRRARGQQAPLAPVDVLRIRPVAFAVAASICVFAAQMASYVSLPFYFQTVLGRPHLQLGMLMAAWPVGTALMAPIAGRLSDRYSAAVMSGLGAIVMALGLVILILLPQTATNPMIMIGMFTCGLGFGFFQTPNNRAMIGSAPRHRAGAIGGVQATTRTFGQSLGTALVATAFGLSAQHGVIVSLILGVICLMAAVLINTVRFSKNVSPAPNKRA
jgi:DHA2 family multidrug resistance protein-like MFS transporter